MTTIQVRNVRVKGVRGRVNAGTLEILSRMFTSEHGEICRVMTPKEVSHALAATRRTIWAEARDAAWNEREAKHKIRMDGIWNGTINASDPYDY